MLDDKIEELTMFEEALEIERPWYISRHSFDHERGQLDIWISLVDKRPLTCSVCNTPEQPFYDIDQDDQTWRHLDFWEFKTFLHAPHPRVACRQCGKVKYALVPWSRHNSSFTLKFDKWVLALHAQMPMVPAARLIREHDTRLWRIVHYYVDKAIEKQDLSGVRHIAVDETSSRRGHQYVTVVVDSDTRHVIYVTEGKDHSTMTRFAEHLTAHQGTPEQITEFCSDMSSAFQKGMTETFPHAHQTIDKFHVMKLLGDAVDETRREEQKEAPQLKKSRYLWLRNERDLSQEQKNRLATLVLSTHKTARAYQLRLAFQEFWQSSRRMAELHFGIWCNWAAHSKLPAMVKAGKTIKEQRDGILRWFETRTTNGVSEAINGLIQAAKRRARGYRTTRNLIAMIYTIGAKFDLG